MAKKSAAEKMEFCKGKRHASKAQYVNLESKLMTISELVFKGKKNAAENQIILAITLIDKMLVCEEDDSSIRALKKQRVNLANELRNVESRIAYYKEKRDLF